MIFLKRAFLAILLGVSIIAGAIGAFRWARWRRLESQKAASTANANTIEFRSVPPFSTKEPERYQATRIVTSVEYREGTGQPPVTIIAKTLIARDGDKRREEYASSSGEALVYLETPEGRFMLSPSRKVFADLNASNTDSNVDGGVVPPDTLDISPEWLLNEKEVLARYEKLGAETINDRAATRYSVTPRDPISSDNGVSVTLIWIDDVLGLPVRSETSSTAGEHPAKLTMELRNLKDSVDPRVFELPKDYRKVEYRRFFVESRLTPAGPGKEGPALPKP